MKKFIAFTCVAVMALGLASCGKGDKTAPDTSNPNTKPYTGTEAPGNIEGMGEAGGTPSGTLFVLPAGIQIVGSISGDYASVLYPESAVDKRDPSSMRQLALAQAQRSAATRAPAGVLERGCGSCVTVVIELRNTTSAATDVIFPAGLVFVSSSGTDQNGLTLKKTQVTVPGGGSVKVVLYTFCCNLHRDLPGETSVYNPPVVSDSPTVLDLCGLFTNKKINIEEFDNDMTYGSDIFYNEEYYHNEFRIQDMVWTLTDFGDTLSDDDMTFINDSIPNSL